MYLLEESPVPCIVVDASGLLLFANERARALPQKEFQSVTGELQSSNQELQSTNDELRSSNEELDAMNRELQANQRGP